MIGGLKVIVSEHCLVSRWVFPARRFVEFEPKDEKWARAIGYGHEVMEPGAYRMGDTLVVHPAIYAELKKRTIPTVKTPNYLLNSVV